MNADDLFIKLEYLHPVGQTLCVEERAALQHSLQMLKNNLKLMHVNFWGKIFGVNKHYLLAQGWGEDVLKKRYNFCSHDGVDWVQLPDIDSTTHQLCQKISGRFTGNPSHEYKVLEEIATVAVAEASQPADAAANKPAAASHAVHKSQVDEPHDAEETDGEETGTETERETETEAESEPEKPQPKQREVRITEEKRLVSVMRSIDHDAAVVPRGAFMLTAEHLVVPNPSFRGLTSSAGKLKSWLHLRAPETFQKKPLLEREGLSKTLDFLDLVDDDIPKGCWGYVEDKASRIVTLRSLLWPGAFAFHVVNTASSGYCYFGTGEKNLNLGFML